MLRKALSVALVWIALARAVLAMDLPLQQGWNLVPNPGAQAINVVTAFGNANSPVAGVTENVQSVWAWNPVTRNWAFYAPGQADGGAAYASGKGYEHFLSAPAGQGFWVNAIQPFTLGLAGSGTGDTVGNFAGAYSGTYSGTASFGGFTISDSGTINATVSATGLITASIHSTALGQTYTASGQVSLRGDTSLTFGAVSSNAVFSGVFNPFSGSFSGTWQNGGFSGAFSGSRSQQ